MQQHPGFWNPLYLSNVNETLSLHMLCQDGKVSLKSNYGINQASTSAASLNIFR